MSGKLSGGMMGSNCLGNDSGEVSRRVSLGMSGEGNVQRKLSGKTCSGKFFGKYPVENMRRNCSARDVCGETSGQMSGSHACWITSLRAAVVICAILVNTLTHRHTLTHTDAAFDRLYYKLSQLKSFTEGHNSSSQ